MMDREKLLPRIFFVVFLGLCGFALWAASIGWDHSLFDRHPLRQTRTAMNTLAILRGGPLFAYEAWIFGPPWNLPFEFPAYQWSVAATQSISGLPLAQSGRLISEFFFWLSLVPAWKILEHLKVRPAHRWLFLSLLLASPLYLFWSRTFMIESTALFLSATYLAAALRAMKTGTNRWLFCAILMGVLAACVKITTFFGFGCAALLLSEFWKDSPSRRLARPVAMVAIPMLAAWLWTLFAAAQRIQNPLAEAFLSTSALSVWSYGTLSARVSSEIWEVIFRRNLTEVAGSATLVLVAIASLTLCKTRRRAALGSFALFAIVVVAFPALHHVHDYYAYANGVFLLWGMGFAILGLVEGGLRTRWMGVTLLTLTLGAQLYVYATQALPGQERRETPFAALVEAIQLQTRPDEVLFIYGQDWSPAIAFMADRRAVMDRADRALSHPRITAVRAALAVEGKEVGGLVACHTSRDGNPAQHARTLGLSPQPVFEGPGCSLYARAPRDP